MRYTPFLILCLSLVMWPQHMLHAAKPVDPVVLSKGDDIDFGFLEFDVTHSGTLQLGTNGVLNVTGTGLASDLATSSGVVTVTAPATGIVEVRCTNTGKLKNGNSSLDLTGVEIAVNTGLPFGSGSACQGTRNNDPTAAVIDLAATPTPNILIGGQMSVPANSLNAGTYTSATGGGSAITLAITIQ